jgi:hypothetical protein
MLQCIFHPTGLQFITKTQPNCSICGTETADEMNGSANILKESYCHSLLGHDDALKKTLEHSAGFKKVNLQY